MDEQPRDALKTIINRNPRSRFLCTHGTRELTALCPITRIPDFYQLVVEYLPGGRLVELKSLKLYLDGYRQREIYHEELLNEIFRDFRSRVRPRWLQLTLAVKIRGGIRTVMTLQSGQRPHNLARIAPLGGSRR